jgi:F-type H+-transporting ATPase subunit alpha
LDAATQARLDRGYRMVEILKQPQYKPLNVVDQILIIYAGVSGYVDDVPVSGVRQWEEDFLEFMQEKKSDVWKLLDENKDKGDTLKVGKEETDETTKAVIAAIKEFKAGYKSAAKTATV